MWWLASLALFFATASIAQFVPAPTDLITAQGHAGIPVRYKQVPAGICEQDERVKNFAGYSDVAKDQHIFWWFFEARNAPEKAPLTIWINGGPGYVPNRALFCVQDDN
jgi:carboxypeptidase C (cathepsin A)